MARKNRLDQAAGESIGGFFSKTGEHKQEQVTSDAQQTTQKTQTAPELIPIMKNTLAKENAEEMANTKPQKQSFSFRADQIKIESWKLYAEAIGAKDLGALWTAAIDEYISNHALTANQQEVYNLKKKAVEIAKNQV